MPDEPVPVPEPELSAPTADELIATAQSERMRSAQLEQEKLRLEQLLATRRDVPYAPAPPREDPLDAFAKDMYTASPEDNKRRLEAAVNQRASAYAGRAAQQIEQRVAAQINQMNEGLESQRVLDRVMMRNPDLADPANYTKYAAMIQKAQLDAQIQGLRLSQDQIADRAVREYRAVYTPQQRPNVPYVEGSSAPGYGGALPAGSQQPVAKNQLEEAYGMAPGEIEPVSRDAMAKITRDYVKAKNADMRKRGGGTSLIVTPVSEALDAPTR